jgi:hypothetical protein
MVRYIQCQIRDLSLQIFLFLIAFSSIYFIARGFGNSLICLADSSLPTSITSFVVL